MGRKRRKGQRGHYCWVCNSILSNESFSGSGHRRHVCKECKRLGPAELVFRQAERDLERCMTFEGTIRRKQRKVFDRFLAHENERVRAYAQELLAMDAQNREVLRQERLEWRREEEEHDAWCARQSALYGLDSEPGRVETKPSDYVDDHADDVQQSRRGTQLSLDFEVGDELPF